jgi:hypothetical protein
MDLSKLDPKAAATKGAVLHLRNPFNNEPLFAVGEAVEGEEPIKEAVTITLMGKDSAKLAAKAKELEKRRMEGEAISDGDGSMEMLAAGAISWTGIALTGETELAECNYDNALALFMAEETSWVGEQASIFAAVRRNFIGNAQKV